MLSFVDLLLCWVSLCWVPLCWVSWVPGNFSSLWQLTSKLERVSLTIFFSLVGHYRNAKMLRVHWACFTWVGNIDILYRALTGHCLSGTQSTRRNPSGTREKQNKHICSIIYALALLATLLDSCRHFHPSIIFMSKSRGPPWTASKIRLGWKYLVESKISRITPNCK